MQLAHKVAIIAVHILVLVAFVSWLPFVFQAMPSEQDLKRPLAPCSGESPPANLQTDSVGPLVSTSQKESRSNPACQDTPTSLLSHMSMLVALIGGGVFSLEAFDAFPV
eukprot:TRINITY_DN88847_c0_g1_i1.p1 TRINITY_DN88847_c0_g1~~TRINITY_DN88847_c0_g1_i1.p1  ORF type:complete len:109 (+),score=21.49 TRINITY_DN88847_c0_g1_i1:121-447(+)